MPKSLTTDDINELLSGLNSIVNFNEDEDEDKDRDIAINFGVSNGLIFGQN